MAIEMILFFGGFKGRIDEFGNMYDSLGSYQGKLERNGNIYDSRGRYKGSIIK